MHCVLFTLFLALVLTGAGQMTGFLPFAVLVALFALCFSPTARRRLPTNRRLLWATLLPILLSAATLLPLPERAVGHKRSSYFNRAQAVSQVFADLGVDLLAGDGSTVADITVWRNAVQKTVAFWLSNDEPSVAEPVPEPATLSNARARPVTRSLTLNRAGTIRTLYLLSGAWACFWLAAGADGKTRSRLLLGLVALGGCVALTGMAGRLLFPQGKTLLWLLEVPHGRPMGPFVNRNHFALFCGMLLPAALLLATRGLASGPRQAKNRGHVDAVARRLFGLVCVAALTAGVAVSLSRSGLLVFAAGLLATVATVLRRRLVWGLALAFVAGGLAIGVWHFPLDEFQDRLTTMHDPLETASAQTRLNLWRDGLSIWRDFPVAGAGADAFRTVYPTRKTSLARQGALHAENEYVQLLADHGLIGIVVLLVIVWAFATRVFFIPRSTSKRTGDDFAQAGGKDIALATLVAVAVHAFFDFGLRMPLNAFVLATILGCAVPLRESAPPCAEDGVKAVGLRPRRFVTGLRPWALAMFLAFLPATNRFWLAAWNLDNYVVLEQSALPVLVKATAWAPSYWHPWHEAGRRSLEIAAIMRKTGDERHVSFAEIGRYCIWSAAFLNASDYRVWMSAARVAREQGDSTAAAQAAARVVQLRPYLAHAMRDYLTDD